MLASNSTLRFGLSALMLTCAPAALQSAVAQEQLAAETFTVSATRHAQPVSEVPSTVSVITAEQIRDNFVTDIKDLIQYEPGVSVRSNPARFTAAGAATGRDGNSGFNIRGLEGNRVLIITDGIRLPDAFSFGAQSVGRGDILDLDTVKSVEILRGPASALYGSDGVAGAVSFITKDPADYLRGGKSWAMQATPGYTSSDRAYSVNTLLAVAQGDWQGMVSYTRRDGHETDTMGTNNAANTDRTTPNPQDISSNAVLAKAIYTLNDAHRFRLTYEYFDTGMEANVLSAIAKPPLASTSTLGLTARDSSTRSRLSFDHHYAGAPGDLIQSAVWAVYYQQSKTLQTSAEDRNTAADRTRINTFDNGVWGVTGQADMAFTTGALTHLVIVGGDVSIDHQEGVRDGTVPPAGESFPTRAFPTTNFTLGGFFIQDQIGLLDGRLTLYPAVRFDTYSLDPKADALLSTFVPSKQDGSHVTPKFGAVFKVTPTLNLYGTYSQGFKAPSPSQVNNAFANLIANYRSIPNANLKPETSETLEGGLRYDDTVYSFSASVFSGQYKDFIDQVQISGTFTPTDPGIFQYINQGAVHIRGAEAKGGMRFENGIDLLAAISYSHGDAINAGVRKPLDSIDPLKLVAGIGYADLGKLFGGRLTVTHSQSKAASRVSTTLCAPSCYLPPSFTLVDLTGYVNITENFTARAGVFNLLDQKYSWWSDVRGLSSTSTVTDAYTQPGRNFGVSLTARL